MKYMPDSKMIGAIGEKDAVFAFRAIGMRVIVAEESEKISRAVFNMVKDGISVIFITESAARKIPDVIRRYKGDAAVSLIPIPGSTGSDGYGMEQVHANVEKAIGTDILINSEQ